MSQTLFRIPFDYQITLPGGTVVPLFGFGLLLALWLVIVAWRLIAIYRRQGWDAEFNAQLILGVILGAAIAFVPRYLKSAPVYGYGAMLLCGFFVGGWLATIRAKREGLDPEIIWDLAMWIFIPGIIGARAFFLIQYRQEFLGDKTGWEAVRAMVNLPQGGLVLFGGVILGAVSFFVFCWRRRISPLVLADIVIPSVFVGLMFGRLGCFLNGCCFGDACDLPWAVSFPPQSVPFEAEVARGFIPASALGTRPLHPTQVYSAIDALVLAILTWNYFPFRRRPGEVLLLGWLLYPILRFMEEVLRADESGQFGTSLTISQWVSLLLFVGAVLFGILLSRWPTRTGPRPDPEKNRLAAAG